MSLGPVMLDVAGLTLCADDVTRLQHPMTGGVILFARNYAAPEQLSALVAEIRQARPHILIATDHEGGRVQRFRDGFTILPAMQEFGRLYDHHPQQALHLARACGYVLAAELRAHGIDFSFAPVLDLDFGRSAVIGSRALHADPWVVGDLAHALMMGMRHAGMAAVAKHFPGHGFVEADSHRQLPVDTRSLDELLAADLVPYRRLIAEGLPAVMPAHVRYSRLDERPAGFSLFWLQHVLREQLKFDGAIISDDLSMAGAEVAGDVVTRSQAALDAGCDLILVCNDADAADRVLHGIVWHKTPLGIARRAHLHGRLPADGRTQLLEQPDYVSARHAIAGFGHETADWWAQDARNSCGQSGTS